MVVGGKEGGDARKQIVAAILIDPKDHIAIVVVFQIGDLAQQGGGVVACAETIGLPRGGEDSMALAAASCAVGRSILMCENKSEQSALIPPSRSAVFMASATMLGRQRSKWSGSVSMSMRMVVVAMVITLESGDAPEWQRLADHREVFTATVPHLGLFLTAGADVQKDRIEVDVWAWGRGLESWLVEHIVIPGGPEDPSAWDKLTALLGRT